jgi:hypothetical protein
MTAFFCRIVSHIHPYGYILPEGEGMILIGSGWIGVHPPPSAVQMLLNLL